MKQKRPNIEAKGPSWPIHINLYVCVHLTFTFTLPLRTVQRERKEGREGGRDREMCVCVFARERKCVYERGEVRV